LELCRPKWRLRYWHERSRKYKFRDLRIADVSEKRREFVEGQYRRFGRQFKGFLRDP
jgi:hypothetical protein